MRAPVGWAKAPAQPSIRMKDSRAPCPPSALMQDTPLLVGTAHEKPCVLEKRCPRLCPPYGAEIGALRSTLAPASKPMRQDLPQHMPLDRLVGCGGVMPPETVALHRFGCRHEPIHNHREIRVRVVEAEDQAAGADPAQRQAFGPQIELEHPIVACGLAINHGEDRGQVLDLNREAVFAQAAIERI